MQKVEYVLGLMFSENQRNVLMIRKNRPDWQAGKLNGIGGKIEEKDTEEARLVNTLLAANVYNEADAAMIREFEEETGVVTDFNMWKKFAILEGKNWKVHVYKTFSNDLLKAVAQTDEELEIVPAEDVTVHNCLTSISYLIPIALLEADFLTIKYTKKEELWNSGKYWCPPSTTMVNPSRQDNIGNGINVSIR